MVGNSLRSRIDVDNLGMFCENIIWDSGDLIIGDGVIDDLDNLGTSSFLTNTLGVQLVNDSYYSFTGGYLAGEIVSPLVTPVVGGVLFYYLPSRAQQTIGPERPGAPIQ